MQPQYAYQTAPMNMMPTFEEGGRVKDTYGLRNAAEQLRERGRGDDTILAHITPEEAGILKLMGGSGTINPYTGLPEYSIRKILKSTPIVKEVYKVGSSVGKEVERGVESIAKDPIFGPIARMASYLHPVSAFLYAGLAPEGSSFDTKGAAKAAAMQQIAQGVKEYAMGTPAGGGAGIGSEGASMSDLPYSGYGGPGGYGPGGFEGAASDAATSYLNPPPTVDPSSITYDGSGIGAPMDQYASASMNASVTDAVPSAPSAPSAPSGGYGAYDYAEPPLFPDVGQTPYVSGADVGAIPGVTTFPSNVESMPQPNIIDRGLESLNQGYNNAANYISELPGRALDYASELPGKALDYASELPGKALDYAVNDPLRATAYGTMAYGGIQSLREAEKQKEEAERVLADQANRTKEEIEFAQSVLREFPIKYQRLTEEDIRRERGKAMGGRITSYDDEPGMDDGMMQGGIAALAKGGLPPRYLRGGGDGMSDSIRARIGGKQEARLADGEFVVPADVVSHLGNGSSNAGAKKLYAMMDRIRKSRTGKTRQAPEVNTRSMMPA